MKRMICILLAAAMLVTACTSGCAENSRTPEMHGNFSGEILRDWTEILGLGEELKEETKDISLRESLHSDNPPDLFGLYDGNLTEYLNEGFCASFTPSDRMLEDIGNMPPIIQQALKDIYTGDGRLYAYPKGVELRPMLFWVPEAWKASPFRDMAPPTCFSELLDFLETYLDTPHDGFCFYFDLQDHINPRGEWIYLLIQCWIIQHRYHRQDIQFNTPEFVPLLDRAVELFNRLYREEPNSKKQKGRQLFTNYYFGYTTNGKDQYTWANVIPWRITPDQPPLMNVWVSLYCARNGSPYSDRAAELFECIVDHRHDPDYDGKMNYMCFLELNKDWIDVSAHNKQIEKKYGSRWKCWHMTQEYVDSIWEIEKHCVPCTVYEDEYLHGLPWEAFLKLLADCSKREISAADFAAEADSIHLQSDESL